MPWRVALALQADGWILRNAIVWHKPNTTPCSVRDRLTCRYEMLFLLAKQQDHVINLTPAGQPQRGNAALHHPQRRIGVKARGAWGTASLPRQADPVLARGCHLGDIWSIPVTPQQRQPHPAAFPVELPLRCIAAGCPPHGSVLDPFSGTGTTGMAALSLGRTYTGIDLNPAFHDIAAFRMNQIHRVINHRDCGTCAQEAMTP